VRLATVGYGVSVNYLTNRERAEALVRKIEVAGGRAFAFQADVALFKEAEALVEETAKRFGGIQIVVNNVGFSQHCTVQELTIKDWDRSLAVNLSAALYTVKAALRYIQGGALGTNRQYLFASGDDRFGSRCALRGGEIWSDRSDKVTRVGTGSENHSKRSLTRLYQYRNERRGSSEARREDPR